MDKTIKKVVAGAVATIAIAGGATILFDKPDRNVENVSQEAQKYIHLENGKMSYEVPEDAPHNVKLYLFFNYKKNGHAEGKITK